VNGDPLVAALNARVLQLQGWLRRIASEAERVRQPRLMGMATSAMAGVEPGDNSKDAVHRATLCLAVLAGIGTPALANIAGLSDARRFGALRDIAELHHVAAQASGAGAQHETGDGAAVDDG
jgi:hypothetical protein